MSDRVRFLKTCAQLVGEKAICVTGEVPHEEREALIDEINYGNKRKYFSVLKRYLVKGFQINSLCPYTRYPYQQRTAPHPAYRKSHQKKTENETQ